MLVVDDNDFNLISIGLQLEKMGLKCDKCISGELAIQKINRALLNNEVGYKIILMDCDMPLKNGFET